jgi:hypothetical protein
MCAALMTVRAGGVATGSSENVPTKAASALLGKDLVAVPTLAMTR